MSRFFGEIEGIPVGSLFENRQALHDAAVHLPLQAGISGSALEGADSIVISGGYEDDRDFGNVIIYTGHGSNDRESGKQTGNQALSRQNLALAISCRDGLPVRVVRGASARTLYSPPVGYEYAGLYRVQSYWSVRGRSGFKVWQFRLDALPTGDYPVDEGPNLHHDMRLVAEPDTPYDDVSTEHRRESIQRIVRSSELADRVKRLYGSRCQVCGEGIQTAAGLYAEGAHIKPIGLPHNGPDSISNILCLCPNHHVMFDLGGIVVEPDLTIRDTQNGEIIGHLTVSPRHSIGGEYFDYHRRLFSDLS